MKKGLLEAQSLGPHAAQLEGSLCDVEGIALAHD